MIERSATPAVVQFGDDFELDFSTYELRRAGRILKLERIPKEILLLLVTRQGEITTREQIVDKIWGKDVFLDTDNSIPPCCALRVVSLFELWQRPEDAKLVNHS